MRIAAIYARVSSEQQREANTIASQTASLIEVAQGHDLEVPKEWVFEDDGYSGATLERPGLERVRDLAAEGQIQVVLVYAPDRLSRKYAYQILLIEELARHGVETRFVKAPQSATAEDQLLVQSEDSFARAQELLQENRIRSRRRTITPSIVQGLVSCQKCGYAFSRTSTHTSARKIHYYKCIGSESWRKLGGPICDNGRLVRQDLLDQIVWAEVIRLLEDPTLIQQELDRRLTGAGVADSTRT